MTLGIGDRQEVKATLFKEVGYSLSKLILDVDQGEIGLPDIQRPFVWTPTKVRDLFDSMYRGFPVGYLLFWSNGAADGARQIGSNPYNNVPRLLIVDGQQRLTSLYAVLKGRPVVRDDYSSQHIQIAFRPRDAKFDVADAAIRRNPEFLPDISQLWVGDKSRRRVVQEFLNELKLSHEISEEEEDTLVESIDRLYDLQSYPFTALELSATVDEEQVADVFVRINSKGVPLNQADFILTLMSVFWDEGRADLEKFCRNGRKPPAAGPSPFNHFIQPDPDQLLRVSVALAFRRARLEHVYSVLRGKNLDTGEFDPMRREMQFRELQKAQEKVLDLEHWHEFFRALMRAGYRSGNMISSKTAMIYSYAMFLIGREAFHVERHTLRDVMARWFFMTALTGRYSSSPETAMEADLARLRPLKDAEGFVETLDRVITDVLTEDFWTISLPNNLATSASHGPSLYGYYAALNLLDARVLFSKLKVSELLDPAMKGKRSTLERHHLFPKGFLRTIGIVDTISTNQVGNYVLVEWPDNAKISDSPPSDYFPAFASLHSTDELARMRSWHALEEGWESLPYDQFLEQRRKGLAKVIRQGFAHLCEQSKAPSSTS